MEPSAEGGLCHLCYGKVVEGLEERGELMVSSSISLMEFSLWGSKVKTEAKFILVFL